MTNSTNFTSFDKLPGKGRIGCGLVIAVLFASVAAAAAAGNPDLEPGSEVFYALMAAAGVLMVASGFVHRIRYRNVMKHAYLLLNEDGFVDPHKLSVSSGLEELFVRGVLQDAIQKNLLSKSAVQFEKPKPSTTRGEGSGSAQPPTSTGMSDVVSATLNLDQIQHSHELQFSCPQCGRVERVNNVGQAMLEKGVNVLARFECPECEHVFDGASQIERNSD